ncbi:Os11g0681400 [Oryza sativa Japonica Group]|uniref:Protein FAR1-RELATED SEQUENCE n=1 Tax=Oryza sativa subsp. japonica TaxID=39947 RepID=Q0IR45_ORYSJ|nr:Os11g0681400 [Oryza sativa Japonica Group]|eukprot:NP_001068457.2 Os11g0681400 [Oryza sativa Japonica Group]
MDTNLCSDDEQEDHIISDEDGFAIEEVESDSNALVADKTKLLEPTKVRIVPLAFTLSYARKLGFGVIKRGSKKTEDGKVRYFTLACSRQGKAQYTSTNKFKPNPSTRQQCPAKVNFYLHDEKFCISTLTLDHNHVVSPSKARHLRCHKKLDLQAKRRLELNDQARIRINKNFSSLVMQAGGYENLQFGEKECRNYLQDVRKLKLGAGDAHAVYQYFLRMTDDFDKGWMKMIDEFSLQDNEWLAGLYDNRELWVPAYVKDTFWAGMSSSQRSESVNAFFDGYVNARTTLKQFVEQYDNALRDKVEKENKSDCKSFQEAIPCITHYEFERQFQVAYTNKKFKEFQDELRGKIYYYATLRKTEGLVHTFSVREDRKIGEQRVVSELLVLFNQEDCDLHCECRHFEFRGILCRHILSILPLVDIEKVPSKYILQRWRKDFKRKHTFIKCSYDDQLDTPIVRRFDTLCKRFNEVAENGSVSDALCNLVMDGLNELQIKIDAHHGSKEIQEYQQNGKNKDMVLKQGKMVLSPISVRRRGRPPSLRKQSKLDQVVRRLRMKKQQESTIEVQSRRRRKTRTKNVISKDKQLINIQNSRQMEVNFDHCYGGAYEAGSAEFAANEFQGLQSNHPAPPSHISSYMDLLQGNVVQASDTCVGRIAKLIENLMGLTTSKSATGDGGKTTSSSAIDSKRAMETGSVTIQVAGYSRTKGIGVGKSINSYV